jgi:hypothetical protein
MDSTDPANIATSAAMMMKTTNIHTCTTVGNWNPASDSIIKQQQHKHSSMSSASYGDSADWGISFGVHWLLATHTWQQLHNNRPC